MSILETCFSKLLLAVESLAPLPAEIPEIRPQDVATDWTKAREWLEETSPKLNDTQLAPSKEDMDAAYRTSQETFRNDVAIALNNNLDWLSETMDRLNRNCC